MYSVTLEVQVHTYVQRHIGSTGIYVQCHTGSTGTCTYVCTLSHWKFRYIRMYSITLEVQVHMYSVTLEVQVHMGGAGYLYIPIRMYTYFVISIPYKVSIFEFSC